jgi:hypothetical protein
MPDEPLSPDENTRALDLFENYVGDVSAALRRDWPRVDAEAVYTCVVEAILELARQPERLDPARGEPGGLIRVAARRRLMDALKRDSRRQAREAAVAHVAEAPSAARDPRWAVEDRDEIALAFEETELDDAERAFLELYAEGEDDPEQLAAALGPTGLDPPARDVEIKRARDRLLRRLRRWGERRRREREAEP